MRIRDITHVDIRSGKNWRVLNPDAVLQDGFPMEDLKIEPLGKYAPDDTLVYSGISVYLKEHGEPRTRILEKLLRRGKRRQDCRFPPDDPKDLEEGVTAIVQPLVMVKEVQESGWGYCERVEGVWRQLGLNSNPDAPLIESYLANPVKEDPEFDICGDDVPLRERHRQGFRNWIFWMKD
jgi:hypothetical protein